MGGTRAQALATDGRAFDAWFPKLLPFAYNVGYRFSGGKQVFAEEVAQETMTRAFVSWRKLDGHPNVEAWVTTAALYVSLELARQQERGGHLALEGSGERLAVVPGDEDRIVDADQLSRAMARLSARQQQVLVWRYYFDESVEQTATRLGLTPSKVKDATHEAVTKLGRLLGPRTGVTT